MTVLDGVRVLDFGSFISGPFCAALLGDFGAEVIRIEHPRGGLDRALVPLSEEFEDNGALYLQINRNKRSLALDIASKSGQAIKTKLIESADVVIANLPDKTLSGLGLDYPTLESIKPNIILCTCTAYGKLNRDKVGFDGIGQAMSGAMHMSGTPGEPRKAYVHYVDYLTASLSAYGVVMALLHREHTGEGQEVSLSLLNSALMTMGSALAEQAITNIGRAGLGNRSPLAGPADAYQTKDGWIIVQVVGDRMFKSWALLLGKPELLEDPRFTDDTLRGENGEVITEMMTEWTKDRPTEECLKDLDAASIPAAPVLSPAEVVGENGLMNDGFFEQCGYNDNGVSVPIVKTPLSLSAMGSRRDPVAFPLGRHTSEILGELGYSAAEIENLEQENIVLRR